MNIYKALEEIKQKYPGNHGKRKVNIFCLRFFGGCTYKEIANMYGVTIYIIRKIYMKTYDMVFEEDIKLKKQG